DDLLRAPPRERYVALGTLLAPYVVGEGAVELAAELLIREAVVKLVEIVDQHALELGHHVAHEIWMPGPRGEKPQNSRAPVPPYGVRASIRANRFSVSRTNRGSARRGASGDAAGTGDSPNSQPIVPDENTSAFAGAW